MAKVSMIHSEPGIKLSQEVLYPCVKGCMNDCRVLSRGWMGFEWEVGGSVCRWEEKV